MKPLHRPDLANRPDSALPLDSTSTASKISTCESCPIPDNDPLFTRYHDTEWGVPATCDHVFFEKICLEGFQTGLSWRTILHRRDDFRQAFDYFDPEILVQHTDAEINRLLSNQKIIRNRRKIQSVINNAQRYLELRSEHDSLARFVWAFEPPVKERPTRLTRQWLADNPSTPASLALSKALKKRGWTFIGPVNMYALMQALGIVNDHVEQCPRRAQIERLRESPGARPT